MSDTNVKFIAALSSNYKEIPIVNGQIIYLTDSSELYFDQMGVRRSNSDVIQIDTEEQILNILSPMSKLYVAKDKGTLWKYINSEWVCLSSPSVLGDVTLNGSTNGITKDGNNVNIDVLWDEF